MRPLKYGVPKFLPDGSRNPEHTRRVNALIRDNPKYKEYQKKWRRANPEKCAGYTQKYRNKNRKRLRKSDREYKKWFRKKYPEKERLRNRQIALQRHGMSPAEYEKLLKRQRYKCRICGTRHEDLVGKRLCVDHCHKTGKNRGLICKSCNTVLGHAKDSVRILKRTISYLQGAKS